MLVAELKNAYLAYRYKSLKIAKTFQVLQYKILIWSVYPEKYPSHKSEFDKNITWIFLTYESKRLYFWESQISN